MFLVLLHLLVFILISEVLFEKHVCEKVSSIKVIIIIIIIIIFGVTLAQNSSMLFHLVWRMEEYFVTSKLSATQWGRRWYMYLEWTAWEESTDKQHWWLRESPWSHFSWKSSVPCFADASSMSGRNRAGFKGKQVVVKLSSNNRLQRVQNLTLYSFVEKTSHFSFDWEVACSHQVQIN